MANPQIENGHIDIANEIADKLCSYRLSGEEWQVLWVILRKTYGWHKEEDWIALSQFVSLTGMKKPNIIRTLKELLSKNIIVVIKKEPVLNTFQDNAVIKIDNAKINYYAFNKDYDTWKPLSKVITLSKMIMPVIKIDNASLSKLIPTKENTTKENITKENNMHGTKIIFNNQIFKFENIPKEKIEKWKEAFLNCNVDIELKKMEAWLAANPERRKKNYEKFIVNWLARAKGEKANGKYIPITVGKAKFKGGTANAGEW